MCVHGLCVGGLRVLCVCVAYIVVVCVGLCVCVAYMVVVCVGLCMCGLHGVSLRGHLCVWASYMVVVFPAPLWPRKAVIWLS